MTKEQRRAANRLARVRVMTEVPDDDADLFRDQLDIDEEARRVGGEHRHDRTLDDSGEAYEAFRVESIESLGRQWNDRAEVAPLVRAAINSGITVAAFSEEVMALVSRATPTRTGRV